MTFLYFYRVPLPDPRADAIQIVNTCAGIAKAGGAVRLHVETLATTGVECLAYYGHGNVAGLSILEIGSHWSWPLLEWRTRGIFRRFRDGCLFVREVRPYVPGLMTRARSAGLTVLFEAHNVSAALVEEKQEKNHAVGALALKAAERAALERSILDSADGLICTQTATLERLLAMAPRGIPSIVLGNGTHLPPRIDPGTRKEIDILYCGSLKKWKGVDTLVEAMAGLAPYRLTTVGPMVPEDVARLRETAERAGVFDRVSMLPPVAPADVWSLYARARVGVIPLPEEGYVEARDFTSPLKLFEMMAAGLPIVASRLRSLLEYVGDDQAVLVEPDDPRALAGGLRRALEDGPAAARMAAAARALAAEHTWDGRGERIVDFADSVKRSRR
jgi:glycosyltransferase involved in cell wall biosynthesis